jgi:hypothetical protein
LALEWTTRVESWKDREVEVQTEAERAETTMNMIEKDDRG